VADVDGDKSTVRVYNQEPVSEIVANPGRNFMTTRNTRLGLWFFGVYLVLYGGFVLLAAFSPESMERTPLAGVNLAIWYGFGLIFAAIVLALVYGLLCAANSRQSRSGADDSGAKSDGREP
jgi:uncharacterized membrane protein (DUF485 family)